MRAETVNRIVAVVNDEVITEADVTSQVDALLDGQQDPPAQGADPAEMERTVLRHLIEQRLLLQEAKRSGIQVSPEDADDRLNAIQSRLGSEEEFERSLERAHVTVERLKEQIRDQLMVQRLVDATIRAKISVSPQEVSKEVSVHPELDKPGDRVRISHLLIRVDDKRTAEKARALIDEIRQRLAKGEAFAALARQYSEDAGKADGGAMDWVAPGELMPELDAVAFKLKAGDYSEPIQSRLGFHLIRVEERRAASSLSLAEAHAAVYQQLYQRKFQEAFGQWLTGLKQRAYIEIPGAS